MLVYFFSVFPQEEVCVCVCVCVFSFLFCVRDGRCFLVDSEDLLDISESNKTNSSLI